MWRHADAASNEGRQPLRPSALLLVKKFAPGFLAVLGIVLLVHANGDGARSLRQLSSRVASKQDRSPTKKVAFMFLASSEGIFHKEMWERWFEGHKDKASVYVHVKDANAMHESSALGSFFERHIIPSVPTEYQSNLFDGMMQLLLYAHADERNAHFIYLSHNSVPLRTFEETYDELVDSGSRIGFMFTSKAQRLWRYWEEQTASEGEPPLEIPEEYRQKSELWTSVSRNHAGLLLSNLGLGKKLLMRSVNKKHGLSPDELFLPTMLLWLTHLAGREHDEGFNTCHGPFPEQEGNAAEGFGCNPTKVVWSADNSMPGLAPRGHPSSPYQFNYLTKGNIQDFAKDGHLLVRKVTKDSKILLNEGTAHEELVPIIDGLLNILERNAGPSLDLNVGKVMGGSSSA